MKTNQVFLGTLAIAVAFIGDEFILEQFIETPSYQIKAAYVILIMMLYWGASTIKQTNNCQKK